MKTKMTKSLQKSLKRALKELKKQRPRFVKYQAKLLQCAFNEDGVKYIAKSAIQFTNSIRYETLSDMGITFLTESDKKMLRDFSQEIFDLHKEFLSAYGICGYDLLDVGFDHKNVYFSYLDCEYATIGDQITHKELFKFFQDNSIVNKVLEKI